MSSTTVLAFDFGIRRIGVAVGDLATGTAHPLTVIDVEDNRSRFAAIDALIREWTPVRLVVGEPRHADGGDHEVAQLVRRFAHRLKGRFGLAVELVDETLSSHAASERLRQHGRKTKRDTHLDAEAACVILETWMAQARQKSTANP